MSTSKGSKRAKVLEMNLKAPRTMEERLAANHAAHGRNKRMEKNIEQLKAKIAGTAVKKKKEPKAKPQVQTAKKTGKKPKNRGEQDNG